MKVSIICISADPKVWYYKEAIAVRVRDTALGKYSTEVAEFKSPAHVPYT